MMTHKQDSERAIQHVMRVWRFTFKRRSEGFYDREVQLSNRGGESQVTNSDMMYERCNIEIEVYCSEFGESER